MALWDVRPGRTGAEPPVNAVQDLAVISTGTPLGLSRQQRRDDGALQIAQFVTACAHQKLLERSPGLGIWRFL